MAGNALPLPWPYLPDIRPAQGFEELSKQSQQNFDALARAIGSGSRSTPRTALTGLYSGTWTDFATYPSGYTKTAGLVVLEGAVTKNPSNTFSPPDGMFTLPAGFRPTTTIPFLCLAAGGTTGTTTGAVTVTVASSGAVQFEGGVTGSGLTNNIFYISLSGIVFRAEN